MKKVEFNPIKSNIEMPNGLQWYDGNLYIIDQKTDNVFIITAKPTNTVDVSDKLIEKGYNVISSEIEMVPKNTLNVKGDDIKKLINLIEHLEEHDDIQNIYSNFEVDDAEI